MTYLMPFQSDGGTWTVGVFWLDPASDGPFDDNDITAVDMDIIDPSDDSIIAADVAMTWRPNLEAWTASRPVTDLDGLRFIAVKFKPTSTQPGALVFRFSRTFAVADILSEMDANEANRSSMEATLVAEHDATQADLTAHRNEVEPELDTLLAEIGSGSGEDLHEKLGTFTSVENLKAILGDLSTTKRLGQILGDLTETDNLKAIIGAFTAADTLKACLDEIKSDIQTNELDITLQ